MSETGLREAPAPERGRVATPPAEVGDDGVTSQRRRRPWLLGIGPLLLVAALVVVFVEFGPVGVFQQGFPPVEELTIERVTLPAPGLMRLRVVNGGPEPVTVAQVLVDDAAWFPIPRRARPHRRCSDDPRRLDRRLHLLRGVDHVVLRDRRRDSCNAPRRASRSRASRSDSWRE